MLPTVSLLIAVMHVTLASYCLCVDRRLELHLVVMSGSDRLAVLLRRDDVVSSRSRLDRFVFISLISSSILCFISTSSHKSTASSHRSATPRPLIINYLIPRGPSSIQSRRSPRSLSEPRPLFLYHVLHADWRVVVAAERLK